MKMKTYFMVYGVPMSLVFMIFKFVVFSYKSSNSMASLICAVLFGGIVGLVLNIWYVTIMESQKHGS